jgi:hypothetical protein
MSIGFRMKSLGLLSSLLNHAHGEHAEDVISVMVELMKSFSRFVVKFFIIIIIIIVIIIIIISFIFS